MHLHRHQPSQELDAALNMLRTAAQRDNHTQYVHALTAATLLGATGGQIQDAHRAGSHERTHNGFRATRFGWRGNYPRNDQNLPRAS